ncbi:integral membrane protein DUF92-domain-containing protein [Tribonema minus]|uniref:Integral membrane protein DUF92-domain-containing protein n=1 Tax=Tribonema minus TaxID=303371 RepID=A0A835Z8S7_9STRA|nr:integral membrane protein DUF92-domain-containing protein [Tribonema minus]
MEALTINSVGFGLFIGSGKAEKLLTPQGAAHAYVLGNILWYALGWRGWTTCVLYLLAGSAVTKVKMAEKTARGIAEGRGGRRGPENVWGSAATGAACALACVVWPQRAALLRVGYAASLATKLGDTFASEIGKAYGRTTYLITTLRPVPAGTEGAVSLEGTAAGVGGSLIIAWYAAAIGLMPASAIGVCAVAAFVACNVESVLGATTQGKTAWLTNEVINFVNTTVGAAVGMALWALMLR